LKILDRIAQFSDKIPLLPDESSSREASTGTMTDEPASGVFARHAGSRGRVKLYGIDGCRGGWVVLGGTASDSGPQILGIQLVRDLTSLLKTAAAEKSTIAIDVPIGLSENSFRQCDREARAFLGQPRGASVFPAPCLSCLGSTSYPDACARNLAASGRSISQQCYGILPKIREMDELVSPERQRYVREVHPEVSFAVIGGSLMLHQKATKEGIAERLALLRAKGIDWTLDQVQARRRELGRGSAHVDDIIDAAVCLLSATRIANGRHRTFGGKECDSRGLRMEIVA
jgi:predicted RNase H-like nuclease